jgi:hypothetical protein
MKRKLILFYKDSVQFQNTKVSEFYKKNLILKYEIQDSFHYSFVICPILEFES